MRGDVTSLQSAFGRAFGEEGGLTMARAPGRVNLIGEHTDYNDGFVFPMAIEFDLVLAVRKRRDRSVRIYAVDLDRIVEFSLDKPIKYDSGEQWSNYLRGVLFFLQEAGADLTGMEIAFLGNIPQGAGLSSSAALEVATALAVGRLVDFSLPALDLARLCQKAENEFVGMKCGVMDQFISLLGEKEHALCLDCRTLQYEAVPLSLGDYRILICQSGVKHSLVGSAYNLRRQQCETGVRILAEEYSTIKALRDLNLEVLAAGKDRLDPVIYRRCRHVVTENARVLESVRALKAGELFTFGELINQSHDSLRDDYEVSCEEVDFLVELAREVDGVLGARITGGGFGGSTVSLIHKDAVQDFNHHVLTSYRQKTGIDARTYLSTAAKGAEILHMR